MKLPRWLLKFSGHTMLHKYPPFFVYRPDIHKVRGNDVRRILDVVCEGDILLRRFDGYLNTIFCPGFYSHAGIYVGGNQVVHAVSQGVISEDILNFCRADAICVLEVIVSPEERKSLAVQKAIDFADANIAYDFDFTGNNDLYYCTEMTDVVYHSVFYDDYVEKFGQLILMPDGIRYSKKVRVKLEVKP